MCTVSVANRRRTVRTHRSACDAAIFVPFYVHILSTFNSYNSNNKIFECIFIYNTNHVTEKFENPEFTVRR